MNIRKKQDYEILINYLNFPNGVPTNQDPIFKFNGRDLVYAIMTCGIINPLKQSSKDFKLKKYMLECQLNEKNRELYLSDDYAYYDPSEKRCLSYYRGMIFGRLLAYQKFNLTHFIHVGVCKRNIGDIITKKINSKKLEPDIIAWDNKKNTEYYIWECKGYEDGLKNGKDQANSIKKVNGYDVKMAIVSAVYPKGKENKIQACIADPQNEGQEIELKINEAIEYYYNPIVDFIKESSNQFVSDNGKMQFCEFEIDDEKYKLGLPKIIFEYFVNREHCNNQSLDSIVRECSIDELGVKEHIYRDFIYIE